MKKLLYRFLFESEKEIGPDSSLEEFIEYLVPEDFFLNQITKYANELISRRYASSLNHDILEKLKNYLSVNLISYFRTDPKLKILLRGFNISTDVINSLSRTLNNMGQIEFLAFKNEEIIEILLENLTISNLLDYSYPESLFSKIGLKAIDKEKYKIITDYLNNTQYDYDINISTDLVDEKIKEILKDLLNQLFDLKGKEFETNIQSETKFLVEALSSYVLKEILLKTNFLENLNQQPFKEYFSDISKEYITSISSLLENLKTTWNQFEGLLVRSDSEQNEINIAEQRFKITLIKFVIQVKKYIDDISKLTSNKWFLAWVEKLKKNLNGFLSIVKQNQNNGYGFDIFSKKGDLNRGLTSSITINLIKTFLSDKEIVFLFPGKLVNLKKSVKIYKKLFELLSGLQYTTDSYNLESDTALPELLSLVV